jgi:serine/threonine-protein kinase
VFAVGIILWEMFTGRRLFFGETDYQTVELVRQARIPSIAALNPEVEPELEAVVRKALAKDVNDRYQNAADLGDALAQYLFSRRMKVTARDIAGLVRDTQVEMMRKRSIEPKESLIDKLILDEMQKMSSLVDSEQDPGGSGSEGSMSLDPHKFVDTSSWASDLQQSAQVPKRGARPSAAPRNKPGATTPPTPGPGEMESLEAMLEPERTGVHGRAERKTPWVLIIIVMVVLAAGAAAAVVMLMT